MRSGVVQAAFVKFSLHAKMHQQLDALDTRKRVAVERIEEAEILSFDQDSRFRELETMKQELLGIRFT